MNVDLARWQFAFVTINHFFFVPITIGLAFLTALLQTAWYRNKRDEYLRLTRFFGTLLVINVAIGVVTGLVQEFQFGMDWGAYSRLVGNVFGAPLAMEGLAAFFLESTFLVDDDFLVLVNSWWEPLEFVLPDTRSKARWRVEIDSYNPESEGATAVADRGAGDRFTVGPRSVVVLKSPLARA